MRTVDFITYLGQDGFYLQAFSRKHNAQIVDITPNTEDYPPRGLLYVFDNLGGFSIGRHKNSLEEKVEQTSGQR